MRFITATAATIASTCVLALGPSMVAGASPSLAGWPPPDLPLALTQTCDGLPATIMGTSGDDVLHGTPGPDVIWAGLGNDVVSADDGNDVVCAGPGDDVVWGGRDHDRIFGGTGNDQLVGQWGADHLYGNQGNDELYADWFSDTGWDIDVSAGGPGDDQIYSDDLRFDYVFGGEMWDRTPDASSGSDLCEVDFGLDWWYCWALR